jgi:general secretion pathway protein F
MSESGLRVSPQQLIALNDEIAMLVRAGVPLELGLQEHGESVPTALSHVNQELSRRMATGLPLGESLAETLPGLPRVYAAVVDAGLKSGDLPKALESLSRLARQGIDLRYRIEFAFLYPLMVFFLAYALFLVFVIQVGGSWRGLLADFGIAQNPVLNFTETLSQHWPLWAGIPPAIVLILLGWWVFVARGSFLPDRKISPLLNLIPGLNSVISYWQWANFCDLLSTLLEHQVPLPKALVLAGDATGSATIGQQMAAVGEDLKTGRSMSDCLRGRRLIPAYLRWSLGTAQEPAALRSSLQLAMELYRGRANFLADAIKMWLPPLLLLVIGGGAVVCYALTMAIPLRALYWQLNLDGRI